MNKKSMILYIIAAVVAISGIAALAKGNAVGGVECIVVAAVVAGVGFWLGKRGKVEKAVALDSSKRHYNNEIRYHKTNSSRDAEPRQGHRLYQIAALTSLERHVRTPGSDVFPYTWRSHERHRISVS